MSEVLLNAVANTIGCSPSQPYYILLGGEHLCAFLHDRRMLGRDIDAEMGGTHSPSTLSEHDDDSMGRATQCVKRFAPKAQRRIKSTDNGHITACKISDASPNDCVVSWSGDWIYSFDMLRTPDAREAREERAEDERRRSNKLKQARQRKRKRERKVQSPGLEEGAERGSSRTRTSDDDGDLALRVRYRNGQSENIPVRQGPQAEQRSRRSRSRGIDQPTTAIPVANARASSLATQSVSMRQHIFELEHPLEATDRDPTGYANSFGAALQLADTVLEEMYDIASTWSYPVAPGELEVAYQNTLRSNRESAIRFIQAAGTLSRLLGGDLPIKRQSALARFAQIRPAPNEKPIQRVSEQFSYDFLKAITLWLSSGPGALIEGFSRESARSVITRRFPCPEGSSIEAIDEHLVPYLMSLAMATTPIYDLSASPFEVDENRKVFSSEKAAVQAFARAVRMPFDDVISHDESSSNSESKSQSRTAALRFWGFRVGRSVLLNAAEDVNHAFIDQAFGGSGTTPADVRRQERALARRFQDIDTEDEDAELDGAETRHVDQSIDEDEDDVMLDVEETEETEEATLDLAEGVVRWNENDEHAAQYTLNATEYQEMLETMLGVEENEDVYEDLDGDEDEESDDDEDNDNDSNSDSDSDSSTSHTSNPALFTSRATRHASHNLHSSLPILPPLRTFTGHCNVKTVKDVNFFGLDDDYVVSGSDSGHVFIWDRHTSQLVNILEGDGEVVNVVQGHPYEPVLAVSGIDSTVKIFSADKRARRDARRGVGVAAMDSGNFSSLRLGGRVRGVRAPVTEPAVANTEAGIGGKEVDSDDTDTEPLHAPNGLSSRKRMASEYEITSRNDHDRRGGNRDAFITRGVLARLAQQIMNRRAQAGGGGGGGGEGQNIGVMNEDGEMVVDTGDCEIM